MFRARDFHDEIVVPTLMEFNEDFSSRRRAFLAVAVLDALTAHIYAEAKDICAAIARSNEGTGKVTPTPFSLLGWHEKGDPQSQDDTAFRDRIAELNDSFRIVRDVAKANKHAELVRGVPSVKRSEQIVSKRYPFGLGRYGEGRHGGVAQVIVQFDDGEGAYLEHAILDAHEILKDLIDLLDGYAGHVA